MRLARQADSDLARYASMNPGRVARNVGDSNVVCQRVLSWSMMNESSLAHVNAPAGNQPLLSI